MPSYSQHLAKVRSNLGFVEFLLKSRAGFLDWAITGYFYSAVHLVEAYFDKLFGKHYGSHPDRRRAIACDANLSALYSCYRQLETYSRVARYGIKHFDDKYINARVMPQFRKFRAAVEALHPDLRT